MIKDLWNDIVNFFKGNIWNIVLFFAVLVIGTIVVKLLINIIRNMLKKTKMESITRGFLVAIVRVILYLVLILMLLSVIGIQISGIITALSAVVLAVGMALQNIIANVANGMVIVSSHIFKKGDWVEVNGVSGSVTNINFLFTTITSSDNKRITIPNSAIIDNNVVNYGSNPTRRIDFTFSVAYETDVETVKKIVIDVMKSNGKIYDNEKHTPFCRLKTLGSSSIDFFANCWVDSDDYWDVYYYVVENVYNEFKRNDISIPYAQLEVRNRTDKVVMPFNKEALPARVEKERAEKEHKFDLEKDNLVDVFKKRTKKSKSEKKAKKEDK